MTEPTRPDIEGLKATLAAATPGTWRYDQFTEFITAGEREIAHVDDVTMSDADGFFIAAAHNVLPALLAYVRALEGLVVEIVDQYDGWSELNPIFNDYKCNYCLEVAPLSVGPLEIPHADDCPIAQLQRLLAQRKDAP